MGGAISVFNRTYPCALNRGVDELLTTLEAMSVALAPRNEEHRTTRSRL
jgi:hypothetical protein